MKILIPTVPHTGTMLLSSLFEKAGFEARAINDPRMPDNAVTTTHIDTEPKFNIVLGLMNKYQAVAPIRHPYLVAESWIRREQPLERLIDAYRRLPALYEAGALFVPVDAPDRDKYIKRINKVLGTKLKPEWGVVVNGFQNTHDMTYRDVTPPTKIKQLADDMSVFLRNFYTENTMTEKKPAKKIAAKKPSEKRVLVECVRRFGLTNELMAEVGEQHEILLENAKKLQDVGAVKVVL